jgi:hypothetical protein
VQTRIAQGVQETLTAQPPATMAPDPTSTPTAPVATETSPSPPATPAAVPEGYAVEEERDLAGYVVRLWRNTDADSFGFDGIATISRDGELLVQIEMASALGTLTGQDVTGEGHPDVIVETFTGGAHCCFSTHVYDLGPELTLVLETPESNCGGSFENLDDDPAYEFITCDDLFAYIYCSYAASPAVQVILDYEPGRGYVPASPRFADLYADAIADHTTMAQNAAAGEMGEWDDTAKCAVLPLMLDYLYTGRPQEAWAVVEQYYDAPDAKLFWAEVVDAVGESSLYVPAAPMPQVALPEYYMLQLLTNCGPERRTIGFLVEGQEACGPDVPQRDVFWLEWELYQLGVLGREERLELTPEDCTTDCRLDVIHSEEGRQASIRLDNRPPFPGAVYRVNGAEGDRWVLRGDLTWEPQAP